MTCGIAWQARHGASSSPVVPEGFPAYLSEAAARLLIGVSVFREPADRNALLFMVGEEGDGGAQTASGQVASGQDPAPPYRPPANLAELVSECEVTGLLIVPRVPRGLGRGGTEIPPVFVDRRTASALHKDLAAAGRGDEIVQAHEQAADYWQWRAAAWPQDQDADLHDLLEARHHRHEAGDNRQAGVLTEIVCAQLHAWGELDRETALIQEILTWLPARSPLRATWIQEIGKIAQVKGNYAEAERRYQQSLEIFASVGDTPAVSRSYHHLGVLAQAQGNYGEAERRYQQSGNVTAPSDLTPAATGRVGPGRSGSPGPGGPPTGRRDPVAPARQLARPAQQVKQGQAARLSQQAQIAQAQAAQSIQATQSAQADPLTQAEQLIQDDLLTQADQLAWNAQSAPIDQPAQDTQPVQAVQPAQADQPAWTDQPARTDQPVPSVQADQPDESALASRSAQSAVTPAAARINQSTQAPPLTQMSQATQTVPSKRAGHGGRPARTGRVGHVGRAGQRVRAGQPDLLTTPMRPGSAARPGPPATLEPPATLDPRARLMPSGRLEQHVWLGQQGKLEPLGPEPQAALQLTTGPGQLGIPGKIAGPVRNPGIGPGTRNPLGQPGTTGPSGPRRIRHTAGHTASPAPGSSRMLWAAMGTAAILAAVIVGTVTGLVPGGDQAGPTRVIGKPMSQSTAALAAADRNRAALWADTQLSKGTVISCDPAMYAALRADHYPAAKLVLLGPSAPDPLGADVVMATDAVRDQFGRRLTTVYAPAVETVIGTGKARIQIRVIAPDGAAVYAHQLHADLRRRRAFGKTLLHNSAVTAPQAARHQLAAGLVDARLLNTLAVLADTHPLHIVDFAGAGPGASPGIPLRTADITGAGRPGGPVLSVQANDQFLHSALGLLRAQRTPYLVLKAQLVRRTGQQDMIRLEFGAPSPLYLLTSGAGQPGSQG